MTAHSGVDPYKPLYDMLLRLPYAKQPSPIPNFLAQILGLGADYLRGNTPNTAIQREKAQTDRAAELQKIWQALMLMQYRRGERGQERYNSPLNPMFANRPLP